MNETFFFIKKFILISEAKWGGGMSNRRPQKMGDMIRGPTYNPCLISKKEGGGIGDRPEIFIL